jgi:hypothetical protein
MWRDRPRLRIGSVVSGNHHPNLTPRPIQLPCDLQCVSGVRSIAGSRRRSSCRGGCCVKDVVEREVVGRRVVEGVVMMSASPHSTRIYTSIASSVPLLGSSWFPQSLIEYSSRSPRRSVDRVVVLKERVWLREIGRKWGCRRMPRPTRKSLAEHFEDNVVVLSSGELVEMITTLRSKLSDTSYPELSSGYEFGLCVMEAER